MTKDNLKSIEIPDIIFRIDELLEMLRQLPVKEFSQVISYLETFIRQYFDECKLNEQELRQFASSMVDQMYVEISHFNKRDIYTDGFFGIVINRLFFELAQKAIRIFYILDNQLRDDRFKIAVELFNASHFSVIYPYTAKELFYGDGYTRLPLADYRKVENQISNCIELKKNIFYVEKDDSVNYLNDIPKISNKYRNEYVYVFRNQGPLKNFELLELLRN